MSQKPVWLARFLFEEVSLERIHTRAGELFAQAAVRAGELQATLIVVASGESGCGEDVADLVHNARVPVLVARTASSARVIVAGTNLDDDHYPVLAKTSELSALFEAQVVVVHSVNPCPSMVCDGVASPIARVDDKVTQACLQLLASVTKRLDLVADFVVSHEANPVNTLLREVRARNSDLIVAGTSAGSSWVAAQLVDRAQHSVLIVPLTGPSPVARAAPQQL